MNYFGALRHGDTLHHTFNADFYTVVATVIPVLFLALTLQGRTFENALSLTREAFRRLAAERWQVIERGQNLLKLASSANSGPSDKAQDDALTKIQNELESRRYEHKNATASYQRYSQKYSLLLLLVALLIFAADAEWMALSDLASRHGSQFDADYVLWISVIMMLTVVALPLSSWLAVLWSAFRTSSHFGQAFRNQNAQLEDIARAMRDKRMAEGSDESDLKYRPKEPPADTVTPADVDQAP